MTPYQKCKLCGKNDYNTIDGVCERCYALQQGPAEKQLAAPKIHRCVVTYRDSGKEVKGYGVLFESGEITVHRIKENRDAGVYHFDSVVQIVLMYGDCAIEVSSE